MSDKFSAARTDFRRRVVRLVRNAVKGANSKIADEAGIRLKSEEGYSYVVEVSTTHTLPKITINAIRRPPSGWPKVWKRLAGADNVADDVIANVQINLEREGAITIKATKCSLTARGPFWPEEFDEGRIKALIDDFVAAVAPPTAKD